MRAEDLRHAALEPGSNETVGRGAAVRARGLAELLEESSSPSMDEDEEDDEDEGALEEGRAPAGEAPAWGKGTAWGQRRRQPPPPPPPPPPRPPPPDPRIHFPPQAPVQLYPGIVVALKGGKNGLWCADEPSGIVCNRHWVLDWERFTVVDGGNGHLGLRGGRSNLFCADEKDHGRIMCNRKELHDWEKFTEVAQPGAKPGLDNGVVALLGGQGFYCADEGNRVICNRKAVGPWEKFSVSTQTFVR